MGPALARSPAMLPILLTLLFGAGLAAGLVLGLSALIRHLRRSTAPTSARAATGVLGFAGLGLTGLAGGVLFVALLAMTSATALLEHGPVRSIQILRLDGAALASSHHPSQDGMEDRAMATYRAATAGLDPKYPVHVLVEYRGEPRLDRLQRWLERETHGDVVLVRAEPTPDGNTRLDFGLDIRAEELEEFEREVERAQPFFDLPHGLSFEIRSADH